MGGSDIDVAARDRLAELSESNALLASALGELCGRGLTHATADALVRIRVEDGELAEFLGLAVHVAPRANLFGLAITLPEYIDRRGAGHDALDYCLSHGGFSAWQLGDVGMYMGLVTTPEAIIWCHRRLTTVIRNDARYCEFLQRHLAVVAEHCLDEMTAYLLSPDRGPARKVVDGFDLVVRHVENPGPFLRRWQEWIWNGLFDSGGREGSTPADIHYHILNQRWAEPAYAWLRESTHDYVRALLQSYDTGMRKKGINHLGVMVETRYRGAEQVTREILPRVHDLPSDELTLFILLREALTAAAASNAAPDDDDLRRQAATLSSEVLSAFPDSGGHSRIDL